MQIYFLKKHESIYKKWACEKAKIPQKEIVSECNDKVIIY